MSWLEHLFGVRKVAIGMVHFPALPGTPLYDERGGLSRIRDQVRRDLTALQDGGIDSVTFCNENDRPYTLSDFGVSDTAPGEVLRYRRSIDATDVPLLHNINAEFAAPLADRPIE